MSETHPYRHSLTGKVQLLTAAQASVFPDYLERVKDGAKPSLPEMHKPGKISDRPVKKSRNQETNQTGEAGDTAPLPNEAEPVGNAEESKE